MSEYIKEKIPLINPDFSTKEKIKYIVYFVLRAFLIASLILILGVFILFAVYFGDLYTNVNSGKYKYPIYNIFVIVSPSMAPTIKVNDGVFVRRHNNFKIGDIITYESIDNAINLPITHRIVSIEETDNGDKVFRTKGDNNGFIDKAVVSSEKILGKVLVKLPKLGLVQSFFKNTINLLLVTLIIISGIIYLCSIKIRQLHNCVE